MIYRCLKKPSFSVPETANDGCLISQWWRFPTAQDRPKLPCGNLPEIVRLLSVYLLGGDQEIMICKGVVKDNVVLLEAGAQLPDGAEVEVRLLERPLTRQEVFARVRTHRIRHPVGMDEIIAEDKQEREEHPDTWLTP
jgi:hypothetical protein